jgi:bidirectional [NiFe] hydrogenase diaphorase subunit
MPFINIDGIHFDAERGTTVLDAARFLSIPIPTICHDDGLSEYGGCRMCIVETGKPPNSRLQTSCTLRVEEGMYIRTHSARVEKARRLLLELYVATAPQSKVIQDLASRYGVREVRLEPEYAECIQCGKCVRMCKEQMQAGALGFAYRGWRRRVMTPFRPQSEICRRCGGCEYICPLCQLRCHGPQPETTLCNGCVNISTPCLNYHEQAMCFLDPCLACEVAGPFRQELVRPAEQLQKVPK